MGCCSSSSPYEVTNDSPLRLLPLSKKEIAKLNGVFKKLDRDGSGDIETAEFLDFADLERTPFAIRCFNTMDGDGSGEVDFEEFCIAIWNYCTFDENSLNSFAFDLYRKKTSKDGKIEIQGVETLINEVYGESKRTQEFIKKLRVSYVGKNSMLSKADFMDFLKKHPATLFPAFTLQRRLRSKILGKGFWKTAATNRRKSKMEIARDTTRWREMFNCVHDPKARRRHTVKLDMNAVGPVSPRGSKASTSRMVSPIGAKKKETEPLPPIKEPRRAKLAPIEHKGPKGPALRQTGSNRNIMKKDVYKQMRRVGSGRMGVARMEPAAGTRTPHKTGSRRHIYA